jgi:hypothetical protein
MLLTPPLEQFGAGTAPAPCSLKMVNPQSLQSPWAPSRAAGGLDLLAADRSARGLLPRGPVQELSGERYFSLGVAIVAPVDV